MWKFRGVALEMQMLLGDVLGFSLDGLQTGVAAQLEKTKPRQEQVQNRRDTKELTYGAPAGA